MKKAMFAVLILVSLIAIHDAKADVLAEAHDQFNAVSAIMDEDSRQTTLYVGHNLGTEHETFWSFPIGNAGVEIIQFLDRERVVAVAYEDWHVVLHIFNVGDPSSVRSVTFWDSHYALTHHHFDERRVAMLSDNNLLLAAGELGGQHRVFVKQVNLVTLSAKNIATFASSSVYFGWRTYTTYKWTPVVVVSVSTTAARSVRSYELAGTFKKIDVFVLPQDTEIVYCSYHDGGKAMRIAMPKNSAWTPPTN